MDEKQEEVMVKVLFVCMGNICRSPMAQGVFAERIKKAGLEHRVAIDSAGTHAFHVGEMPDERARNAASKRGIDISDQRARRFRTEDFEEFDYVLAMDRDNHAMLRFVCPSGLEHKLRMFLEFASEIEEAEVPDPYYGGERGFEKVLDLVERAAEGLLEDVRSRYLS